MSRLYVALLVVALIVVGCSMTMGISPGRQVGQYQFLVSNDTLFRCDTSTGEVRMKYYRLRSAPESVVWEAPVVVQPEVKKQARTNMDTATMAAAAAAATY